MNMIEMQNAVLDAIEFGKPLPKVVDQPDVVRAITTAMEESFGAKMDVTQRPDRFEQL